MGNPMKLERRKFFAAMAGAAAAPAVETTANASEAPKWFHESSFGELKPQLFSFGEMSAKKLADAARRGVIHPQRLRQLANIARGDPDESAGVLRSVAPLQRARIGRERALAKLIEAEKQADVVEEIQRAFDRWLWSKDARET